MPLRAGARASCRTSSAIPAATLERARLMFLNYPNNPTGAVVPDGFFERGRRVRARARPAGRARQRLLGADLRRLRGAELPRDAGRDGRRRRGVLALQGLQHDRLALRARSSATRTPIARYWKLKTNVDSGLFEAVQLAGAEALDRAAGLRARDVRDLRAPARPGDRRAARDRHRHRAAEGNDLRLGARAARATRRRRSRGGAGAGAAWSSARAPPTGPTARASSASR